MLTQSIYNLSLYGLAIYGEGVAMTAQHILAPAYIYPTLAGWTQELGGYPTVTIMIANPASGPGVSANSDYTTGIANARAAGIKVLGYVFTSYGARSSATVEADIDAWYSLYTIDGIMLDEVQADTAHLSYYTTLYNYIKAKDATRNQVVLNPGTVPTEHGFTSIADTICLFEESYAGWLTDWASVSGATWITGSPASKWWAIVYNIPSVSALYAVMLAMKQAGVGFVFVTDLNTPNPYGDAPSLSIWSPELSYAGNVAPQVLSITFVDHLTLGYGSTPYGAWDYGIGPYFRALPSQRINALLATPAQHVNASFATPIQHINPVFTEVAMTTPFTTVDSSATVTNQNGTAISNLSAFTLTVTYPDSTTATPAVANEGSGIYTATYNTKMAGTITELWSFTDSLGAIAQDQRTLVIAY